MLKLGQQGTARKKRQSRAKRQKWEGTEKKKESEKGVTLIPEWERKKLNTQTHRHTHLVHPVSSLYLTRKICWKLNYWYTQWNFHYVTPVRRWLISQGSVSWLVTVWLLWTVNHRRRVWLFSLVYTEDHSWLSVMNSLSIVIALMQLMCELRPDHFHFEVIIISFNLCV